MAGGGNDKDLLIPNLQVALISLKFISMKMQAESNKTFVRKEKTKFTLFLQYSLAWQNYTGS